MLAVTVSLPCAAQLMPPAPPFPDPNAQSSQTSPTPAKSTATTPKKADDDQDPLNLGLHEKKDPQLAPPPAFPVPSPTPLQGPAKAQASGAQVSSPYEAEGEKAMGYLLKHVVLDPHALVPGTGQPLTDKAIWAVGKQRPVSCPKVGGPTDGPCVLIVYHTADNVVSCQWVVLMKPDGSGGQILEQNKDATHFLLRNVPTAEAAPLVVSRHPKEEGGRQALRLNGTVDVAVVVNTNGEPTQVNVVDGPPALRTAAYDMARQWMFRPMTVGARAIPYQVNLKFHFDGPGVKTEP
jgi:TonB family protein